MHTINTNNPIDFPKVDYVWEGTVDNGQFHCSVTRLKEYQGLLKVIEVKTSEVLLEKAVTLSYNAVFGPDVDDVMHWQDISVEAIDNYIEASK